MKFSTHSEYFNEKGVQVPSATTVLKLINKPSLQKWANIMGFKRQNTDIILERSADIGTVVHALIEKFMMKREYEYKETKYHDKELIASYLDNFLSWYKKNEVTPIDMEIHMTHELYGGTVDFYGDVNGKKTILDFKTSKAFYETMYLQLGAYVQMLEAKGNEVEQVAILRVNQDKHAIKFKTREEIQPYIDCFNVLVDLFYQWSELSGDF